VVQRDERLVTMAGLDTDNGTRIGPLPVAADPEMLPPPRHPPTAWVAHTRPPPYDRSVQQQPRTAALRTGRGT
jgi:hypothetical protein